MGAVESVVCAVQHTEACCFYCPAALPLSTIFSLEILMEMFIS